MDLAANTVTALLSMPWTTPGSAAAATAISALVLVRLAPRAGWLDAGEGVRKLQTRPVAVVGGAAILVGLAVALLLERLARGDGTDLGRALAAWLPEGPAGAVPWALPALIAAFGVGLWDDLAPGGLTAGRKLAGQTCAGLLLAFPLLWAAETGAHAVAALALILAAVVAQNAMNTFDNADGAALSLASAGLVGPAPILAIAPASCLPFNLRPGRSARLYLGDSGSHLLAILLLLHPAAWGTFALPLFDLARVSAARLRAGQAPWIGDRRHLAHRLQRRGLAPGMVALVQVLIAAPSIVLCAAAGDPFALPSLLGAAATCAVFLAAVAWTREPAARP